MSIADYKIRVSQVQRENLLIARAMWLKIQKSQVSKDLGTWRSEGFGSEVMNDEQPSCGTIACFGGWCAWVPEFMAQGVYASDIGSPDHDSMATFATPNGIANSVSLMLFGNSNMFRMRADTFTSKHEAYDDSSSDWQIVMNRIDALLEKTVVA